MSKVELGKGGNFESKNNPFYSGPQRKNTRPVITDFPSIAQALELCIAQGCACMVGGTRDNGAVVLTILDGDKRLRTYCSNDQELSDAIEAMSKMYADS